MGEFGLKSLGEGLQTIDSVVPGRCLISTEFEDGKEYFSETLPNEMNESRVVTDYSEILFERNGKGIKAKARDLWEVENDDVNESHSFKLLSHPDKHLIDHLRNVGVIASKTVSDKQLNIAEANLLRDMAYIIGVTHDFGKATGFFQKYIKEKDEKRRRSLKAMDTTHHGLLSAFFTYSVVKEYLRKAEIRRRNIGVLAGHIFPDSKEASWEPFERYR